MFTKQAATTLGPSRAFTTLVHPIARQLVKKCSTATRANPITSALPSVTSVSKLSTLASAQGAPAFGASHSESRNSTQPGSSESKSGSASWFQPAMVNRDSRAYEWVDREAEILIAKAYSRHKFGTPHIMPVSSVTTEELEKLGTPFHYQPQGLIDSVAYGTMRFLRVFTHTFFRDRYDHHALILETVAAVPGIVGAAFRHLRSLRWMERDNGWINPLQEEAENERMHLLIWMKFCQPTLFERFLVILAQAGYLAFYTLLYAFSPRSAHRMVGYLEEEAHLAYTAFLRAVDEGKFVNAPAPDIAINYYRLPADAKLRDVILHVRADECMHRDFNHMLADKHKRHDLATPPYFPGTMRGAVDAPQSQDGHQQP